MNIGAVIKNLRKDKGISQGDFAKRCDITQTYLSLIEGNKKDPSISKLKEISNQLQTPLNAILLLSLEREDVPDNKKDVFDHVETSLKSLIKAVYIG